MLVRLNKLGSKTPSPRVLEDPTHDRAEGMVAPPQGARTCPNFGHLGTEEHSLEGMRRGERLAGRPKVSYQEEARQWKWPTFTAPDPRVRIPSSTAPLSAGSPEPCPQNGPIPSEGEYHHPSKTTGVTNVTRMWGVDGAEGKDGTVDGDGVNEMANEDGMNELVDEDRIDVINEKMTESQRVIEQIGEMKQNPVLDRTKIKYCDNSDAEMISDNSDAEMISDNKHKMFKRDDKQKMMKCDSDKHVAMVRSEHRPLDENHGISYELVEYEGVNGEIFGREQQTSGSAERWSMPPDPRWTWRTASRI